MWSPWCLWCSAADSGSEWPISGWRTPGGFSNWGNNMYLDEQTVDQESQKDEKKFQRNLGWSFFSWKLCSFLKLKGIFFFDGYLVVPKRICCSKRIWKSQVWETFHLNMFLKSEQKNPCQSHVSNFSQLVEPWLDCFWKGIKKNPGTLRISPVGPARPKWFRVTEPEQLFSWGPQKKRHFWVFFWILRVSLKKNSTKLPVKKSHPEKTLGSTLRVATEKQNSAFHIESWLIYRDPYYGLL